MDENFINKNLAPLAPGAGGDCYYYYILHISDNNRNAGPLQYLLALFLFLILRV